MGIELPRELAGLAAATGLSWPQADEDKLREQANAWRTAQRGLTSLAAEADRTASDAVGALSPDAAEAAGRRWSGFVDADHGKLTAAARGAGEAADRLDHAADQVGAAKVEMIRQLTGAAKDTDAAHAAASAGHPTALLGLDTVLKGTATNLSAVTHGLADTLGPGGGPAMPGPLVDPHPGAHTAAGQNGLLSTVTGLSGHLLPPVDAVATPLADSVADTVDKVAPPVTGDVASNTVVPVLDDPAGVVDHTVSGAGHTVDDLTGSTMDTPRQLPRLPSGPPVPVAGADAGTGPVQLPQVQESPMTAHTPPSYGGFLHPGGFDDAPTPPSGLPVAPHSPGGTVASGFTDASYSPAPVAGPGFPPAAPAPVPPVAPQPGYQLPPAFVGGAGAVGGPAVSPPAVFGGGPPPGTAVPGVAPVAGPGRMPAAGGGVRFPQHIEPQPHVPPRVDPPRPDPQLPVPPLGAPRQERESIVALFLVHMFPIGHLPVASDRPQRQLPVPPPDADYAPGLRFPPHDHPRSDLIDSADALEKVGAGLRRLPTPPASPPAAATEGYQPLAGLAERDWNRRFLAGVRDSVPEYAWPPGEVYPEGGTEPGEPRVLAEGTMLDRFGDITGRVFAPEGTGFAYRSLPPSVLDAGYRRYRVLREVPMWQARSVAWFGQPGGALRYRAVYSADELVTMGYLADVTFEETE